MSTLSKCRQRVHEWGKANRVTFDAYKEHLVVPHPAKHHGEASKLLGCMMHPDLRMPPLDLSTPERNLSEK